VSKLGYIRVMVGIAFLYACKKSYFRFQKLALVFRRLGWRIAGRGKAPPLTYAVHIYACVRCHAEHKLATTDISHIAKPMEEMYCSKCRDRMEMGWMQSTVEIVR